MKVHSPAKGPSYHFSTDIPEFYEDTLLRIVPCNPHQRYVYWEIPADIRSRCTSLILRISQVNSSREDTSEPETITEYPLDPKSTHHYITLSYPTLEYQYELLAVYDGSSPELICSSLSTSPEPEKETDSSDSDEIVVASTPKAPDGTPVSSPVHQKIITNQSATITREVPVIPSSWHPGNTYSS